MTHEEAIEILYRELGTETEDKLFPEVIEARDMAIKALEERKAGKWILKGLRGEKCVCGLCGSDDKYNLLKYNYCQNCGAKMKWSEADVPVTAQN